MPSLRKSGKTWRKGKLHRRGRPASLALGHERGRVPGWQQHLAQSSRASRAPAAWVWDGAELGAVVPSLVPGQKQRVQPSRPGPSLQQEGDQETGRRRSKGRPRTRHPAELTPSRAPRMLRL